ncbi:hypothetical protein ACJ73_04828 [Blastomyces percursus]|uniref:Uncharacterized protein n=1 Tax=Blastomyces percursus TaxID=1658174 RepID=A0A1J9R5P4_9EURO|nr:hypothetical protein ACJ73_04828 [Blastomyces percursus]
MVAWIGPIPQALIRRSETAEQCFDLGGKYPDFAKTCRPPVQVSNAERWRLSRNEPEDKNFAKNEPDPSAQTLKLFAEFYVVTRNKPSQHSVRHNNSCFVAAWEAQAGAQLVVRILIDRGANVNLAGRNGLRPLEAAVEFGHGDEATIVKKILEKNGAKRSWKHRLCHRWLGHRYRRSITRHPPLLEGAWLKPL